MAQRPTRSRAATRPLETLTGVITAWSRPDPSAAWEVERHWRIQAIQGKGNRFVEDYAALFGKTAAATPATPPAAPVAATPALATPVPAVSTPTASPQSWTWGPRPPAGR